MFKKADGSALPNPLQVGITATTLGGAVHDRNKHLRAVVTPASEAGKVTIEVSSELQLSNVAHPSGAVTFDVVGTSASTSHSDSTITARHSGTTVATAVVEVIVPHNVSATHDTVGGGLVIANRALDASTSPAILGVPAGQVELSTIYVRFLTITVCDQFGGLIGELYQGAEISEGVGLGRASINQVLTALSTYADPVGTREICCNVAAGSAAAQAWPSQPQIALTQNGSLTQNISVFVDGFSLSPAIANRLVTVSSSPVSVTITWP